MRKDRDGRPRYCDYEPSSRWQGGPIGEINVAVNTGIMVYPASPEGKPFAAVVRDQRGEVGDRSYLVEVEGGVNISLGHGTAVEIISRNCK